MSIESRWPRVASVEDLKKVTATLKGKLPPSPHALCDMLDAEAARVAREKELMLIASAGATREGSVEEQVARVHDVQVEREVEEMVDGKPLIVKRMVTEQVNVTETITISTLSRDYWAAPA